MERTLILVKPDAVQRGLIGEVLGRLERRPAVYAESVGVGVFPATRGAAHQ